MRAAGSLETTSEAFRVRGVDRASVSAETIDLAEMLERLYRSSLARRSPALPSLTSYIPEIDDALTSTTQHSTARCPSPMVRGLVPVCYGGQWRSTTTLATTEGYREAAAEPERREEAEREAALREVMAYKPRTALGRQLCALHARIIASGVPLLSREDIDRMIAESRGGYDEAAQ